MLDKKVAVIGEDNPHAIKGSLTQRLIERFKFQRRNFKIFTKTNRFEAEDAEQFDVLVGVRPCNGEIEILKGATKYEKEFILLPCTCECLQVKVLRLIREYPVIKKIEAYPGQFTDGNFDSRAWIILYN